MTAVKHQVLYTQTQRGGEDVLLTEVLSSRNNDVSILSLYSIFSLYKKHKHFTFGKLYVDCLYEFLRYIVSIIKLK